MRKAFLVVTVAALLATQAGLKTRLYAQASPASNPLAADVDRLSAELNPQVVRWRRDFHKNPELGQ
jgi:hypothetical protein